MQVRRLAAALGVVLAMGATSMPAAPAADGPSESAPTEAEMLDRYRAFAQEHGQPVDVPGGGDATLPFCHGALYEDGHEGGTPGISDYGIIYWCGSNSWEFHIYTEAYFESAELGEASVLIDRDRNASTGCRGVDVVAYATYGDASDELQGIVFSSPTCDDSTWVPTGPLDAAGLGIIQYAFEGNHALILRFPASAIGGDRQFRWKMIVANAASCETTCDYDVAPDAGWREMTLPCGLESTAFKKATARAVYGVYDEMVGGDFNGDSFDDLFFYGRGAAEDGLLRGSGSGLQAVSYRPPVNGYYDDVVSGDFNGDGADDVFFYGAGSHPDGYLLATPGSFALEPVANPVQVTRVYDGVAAGDFNGDGLDDLFFYGAGARPDGLLRGTANGLRAVSGSAQVNGTYQDVAGGDVNGDGFDDVAFYGLGTAPEGLLRGSPTWLHSATPGSANGVYDSMVGGDFNGDGRSDLLFYAPGRDCEGLLRGTPTTMKGVSTPGVDGTYDAYTGGDFDGDGNDDVFFYGRGSAPEGQLLGR